MTEGGMTNRNCPDGMRCPKCSQDDRFSISAVVECRVTDDGSEPVGDHVWGETGATRCPECGREGPLGEFQERDSLSPDFDGSNDDRAAWAGSAPAAFVQITGTDEDAVVGDLLTDLLHWCDRNGRDFALAPSRAEGPYAAGTGGEESR